jgi:DNA-binding response OmpR family regulator
MGVNNMKILIAEDDSDIALMYRVALHNRNHHVVITDNGEDCITIYREELRNFISRMGCHDKNKLHVFDMVILDYRIPRMDGIEVAKEIISINPRQRIIIVSAYLRETIFCSVKKLGGVDVEFVQKPFNIETLIDRIENEHHSELQGLKRHLSDENLIFLVINKFVTSNPTDIQYTHMQFPWLIQCNFTSVN